MASHDGPGIGPPHSHAAKVFKSDGEQHVVPESIDVLVEDDVFPDLNDKRIAYLAIMPKGYRRTVGANGSQTFYDCQFPFDEDYHWVGRVRPLGRYPEYQKPRGHARRFAPHTLCLAARLQCSNLSGAA